MALSCEPMVQFLNSKQKNIIQIQLQFQTYSYCSGRVSKSHGLTLVRERKILMTFRKILRFACTN